MRGIVTPRYTRRYKIYYYTTAQEEEEGGLHKHGFYYLHTAAGVALGRPARACSTLIADRIGRFSCYGCLVVKNHRSMVHVKSAHVPNLSVNYFDLNFLVNDEGQTDRHL